MGVAVVKLPASCQDPDASARPVVGNVAGLRKSSLETLPLLFRVWVPPPPCPAVHEGLQLRVDGIELAQGVH